MDMGERKAGGQMAPAFLLLGRMSVSKMNIDNEAAYHKLISIILIKRPKLDQMWGLWIRQYPSIPDEAHSVDFQAFPDRVWFLEDGKLRSENPWKWMRFLAAQRLAPMSSIGRVFPIGLAAFAPYSGGSDYYVEFLWGGLWGEARRYKINRDDQIEGMEELWKA